jgi:mono/diheme cytochrome c family protein
MANEPGRVRHRLALALTAAILVGVGGVIGIAASGGEETKHTATEPLKATSIGDPAVGRGLFVSQHCSDCHSYAGRGGSDAPPLDSMRGKLAARDIANMSGTIWNHVPLMVHHFKEEGIPYPSFSANEMADLIAYLHGGGPPPDVR